MDLNELRLTMQRALTYIVIIVFVYMGASTGYYNASELRWTKVGLDAPLEHKLHYYQDHAHEYDVIFIGDSRTYCDIQPGLFDAYRGTRSVNLSRFAHWFPTQYPFVKDLIPQLAPGTSVVWAVGHQNFFPVEGGTSNYPISPGDMLSYVEWGFSWSSLFQNFTEFNPLLRLYADRGKIRKKLLDLSDKPFGLFADARISSPIPNIQETIEALHLRLSNDPGVARVEVTTDGDRITSAVLYKKAGSYYRMELDYEYFREKQTQFLLEIGGRLSDEAARVWPVPAVPDELYGKLFVHMLEMFRRADIRLIVVELEEAPFVYRNPIIREHYRTFMWKTVRPTVESYGFHYVRLPLDQLDDTDYFDFNHMNSRGIEKFTPLLSQALKPYVASGTYKPSSYTLLQP
jgi:hypothetical protein